MMNRDQVVQLFKFIKIAYENFEVNSDKVDFWHEILQGQDYKQVMLRFKRHVKSNRFAPTIAELYEDNPDNKINYKHLEEMRRLRNGQLN